MYNLKTFTLICLLLHIVISAYGRPESINPNLEYELIGGGPQVVNKPAITTTRKPVVINTPPPVDPTSKTFAFDPKSQSWSSVKKTDPKPAEGTLLWNQSNDKYLTK
ncbi:uncharacterized protein LOC119672859 [Teleopsis dalmanni]|uniref:uncharacterized protein LOC119672859 n=1 Tax=Teleopsis dalmanni TaxID=139649 RepID=UPI0018CF77A2|nr:uncharacterized protein LOC119672859 [Teleopsis dalmanni]